MKASSILFATIFFLSTGGGCKGETNLMDTKCVLEIKLLSPQARRGQDVSLNVQLKNMSAQRLWVNQRLLLNIVDSPPVMRELWFDVVGPDGAPVAFSAHVRAGEAVASNFNVLKPGEVVSKQIKLSNYFEFDKPGVYQITAHYQDGTTDVPQAPNGVPHFQEPLSSAAAKLELLAP